MLTKQEMEDTIKDKTADLYSQLFIIRVDLQDLEKKVLRRFTEVRKSQNIVIGFWGLDKIEDHLKLSRI